MTEKQIEQRRAAGRALAAKVSPEYFRFIGRRGGRRFMFNQLNRLADNFNGFDAPVKCSPARFAEIVADQREHYRQEAQEKYFDFTGNRLFLQLFEKESEND